MFERPQSDDRAILVHVDLPSDECDSSLTELSELVSSAGAKNLFKVFARRERPSPRLFIGTGKAQELRDLVVEKRADMVVFDHPLTPGQERNLEYELKCRVLDRITIILDIFAQRASTFEGKLQVELAQLKYLSTRLVRGWTHLERQKGGIGLRGPGEKQLETDRRLINERIRHIDSRLVDVAKRRSLSRRARSRAAVSVVALVGYTNSGKSTLFNYLTDSNVGARNRLFETLDPTIRKLGGAHGKILIADTVGFIRNLPHELVAAFRATLEETRKADLLLHVIDASDPEREQKRSQVNEVLSAIGAGKIAQLEVFNKIDRKPEVGAKEKCGRAHLDRGQTGQPKRVWVSALAGTGLAILSSALMERVSGKLIRATMHLPVEAGKLRARLFEVGTVLSEKPLSTGVLALEIEISQNSLKRLYSEGLKPTYIAA